MSTTKTFSLYLAKEAVANLDDLLTDKACLLVKAGKAERIPSAKFADKSVLFTFPGHRDKPKWVEYLTPTFSLPNNLFSQSPCALLAFEINRRLFAITFSYAHVYLDDRKTEPDFGLRVAINAVSDGKLRSVERSNIGAAIRDFAQAAGQRDLKSFGFDDALDLIRKVSGYTADSEFADTMTGARALRFSKKMEIISTPDAAVEALKLFGSTSYKKTAFKIIDFLSPVSDRTTQERLDDLLVEAVRSGSDDFEITIPEILPDGVVSYRFEHAGFNAFHPDLSLDMYREGIDEALSDLTLNELKKHRVAAYSDDHQLDSWSIHDALIGSMVDNGERYALNEGYWYCVNKKFKEAADKKFEELCKPADPKLRPFKQKVQMLEKGQKQKTFYQSEESYNKEIAKEAGYLLLDRKLIEIEEIPGPGIEVCDLLDIPGRRLIHVKKSSRQSSILSHFFKQGGNSAQMLRQYEAFRLKMLELVSKLYGADKARELDESWTKRWTIEFQIADFPRRDGKFNIPFFSKLTLRHEARNIDGMGFDVAVRFIKLSRK